MALINYAQMPVMQPRSEMTGFTDALLKTGAMRQERLQNEEAQQSQQEQQSFENELALQRADMQRERLGMQQERLGMAEQELGMQQERLGLAKAQDERAAQESALRTQQLTMQVENQLKDQAFANLLQQPEVAQQIMAIEDPYAQREALFNLKGQAGLLTHQDVVDYSENEIARLEALQEQEDRQLDRQLVGLKIAATKTRLQNAKLEQQALQNPQQLMDPKQLEDNLNKYEKRQREFMKIKSDLADERKDISLLISALKKPDPERLKTLKDSMKTAEGARMFQDLTAMYSGKDPAQQEAMRQQKLEQLQQVQQELEQRERFTTVEWAKATKAAMQIAQSPYINREISPTNEFGDNYQEVLVKEFAPKPQEQEAKYSQVTEGLANALPGAPGMSLDYTQYLGKKQLLEQNPELLGELSLNDPENRKRYANILGNVRRQASQLINEGVEPIKITPGPTDQDTDEAFQFGPLLPKLKENVLNNSPSKADVIQRTAKELKKPDKPARPSKASLYTRGSSMPFQGVTLKQFNY